MTTIDTSKASRELDIWLATNIMGWARITHFYDSPIADGWIGFWSGEWFKWIERPSDPEDESPPTIWHPTESRIDSLELVDKLIADGADWEFGYQANREQPWYAILIIGDYIDWPLGNADTLPLAICKALYKWKEGE